MSDEEPTLNIPSLLTLAVVSFFVIRWFLNRDSGSAADGPGSRSGWARTHGGGSGASRNAVDPARVEQVAQMFPQLSTRDIMWDLQRNGGSVAATTERILTGRGLDAAPPSFQPRIPVASTAGVAANSSSQSAGPPKPETQDLISRYNLKSRLSTTTDSPAESAEARPATSVWSQSKDERQRLLQKRRDDMILAARRKMMEKDAENTKSS